MLTISATAYLPNANKQEVIHYTIMPTIYFGFVDLEKKTEWCSAGVVICLERGADLHMAQLIPLQLTVSCFSKIQISFYLSGTGSPG